MTANWHLVLAACLALAACSKSPLAPPTNPTADKAEGMPTQYGTPYAEVPATKDVVLYQVNFHSFQGKSRFAAVQARLEDIRSLGVNTLYLMPIYPVGLLKSVNSPYCVRDYKAVNSEFGTLSELRSLVAEAHKKHMAVLFDWVADHTAWDHAWISNKSWYKQDAAGNIIPPPKTGWNDVAALNYDNMDMRKAMIDAMRYWVYEVNIDGYRCDAADFMPFDFWQQAINSLRAIATHKLLLFAEGTRKDQFTAGFQLEYGMAFYSNMVNRIYRRHESVQSIDSVNTIEYKNSIPDNQVVRYVSNHDVDQSEGTPLAMLNGKKGSLAAFVVAAYMKGVPMLYNGQEVGCPAKLSFFDDSTPIDWTLNPDLVGEYRKILALRSANEVIKRGDLNSYSSDDVCVFTKSLDGAEILVVVNLRNTDVSYETPQGLSGSAWKDAFDGSDFNLGSRLELPPYQYRVFRK